MSPIHNTTIAVAQPIDGYAEFLLQNSLLASKELCVPPLRRPGARGRSSDVVLPDLSAEIRHRETSRSSGNLFLIAPASLGSCPGHFNPPSL